VNDKLKTSITDVGAVIEIAVFPDGKGSFHQATFKAYKKY
jgi:hypothetical protein